MEDAQIYQDNGRKQKSPNRIIIWYKKYKEKWLQLPYKLRFVLSGFLFATVVSFVSILLVVGSVKEGLIPGLSRPNKYTPVGEWKKLEIPQREPPFFTLSSRTQNKFGIIPSEILTLKTKEPVDIGLIRNNIDSTVPLQITQVGSQEFNITPQNNLGLDQIINIQLEVEDLEHQGHTFDRNYSWAFQTQGKFRVISSIPGDQKKDVPIQTGIEIVFSQDDYNDASGFIDVQPEIEYRLERHAETLSVVPLQPLEPKTVYTITLRRGLNLQTRNDPIQEDYTFSFQTTDSDTTRRRIPRLDLEDSFQQISSNEPLVSKVHTGSWNEDENINAKVYKFVSATDFINSRREVDQITYSWMNYYAEGQQVDTNDLSLVLEADIKIQSKNDLNYLQLPDKLDQGFYLVQFWYDNGEKLEQLWLQSTNLTGYVSVGRHETLVWVNEINGSMVDSAQVNILGANTQGSTNGNGIVKFGTPATLFEGNTHYVQITKENDVLILPVNSLRGRSASNERSSDDYWSYLYHERRMYRTTDQIDFWGIIKERSSNQPPSLITAVISTGSGEEVLTQQINPQADGTFIGNFNFSDFSEGWYYLKIKVGELTITDSGLSISSFEKPEMEINVSANKKAIFTNEEVEFNAKVEFFDGTPAKHIPVKIYETYKRNEKQLDTGENGEVIHVYKPTPGNPAQYPRYESITVSPTLAQQGVVEGHGSVYVFDSRLMIDSERKQEGNKATITASVNRVNLDRINSGESNDIKGDLVANKDVQLKITKTWWEKVESGTYYDFIEKVTRPRYRYVRHDETVENKKLTTNSYGMVHHEFELEEGRSYQTSITVQDEFNRPDTTTQHFYYNQNIQNQHDKSIPRPEISNGRDEAEYSINETVDLSIILDNKTYPDNEQTRYLFIITDQGRQNEIIRNEPNYSFNFQESYNPNIYAGAVVFNGKYYELVSAPCRWNWFCYSYSYYERHNFQGIELRYKQDDSKLDIEITTNKSEYKPGENASISIEVTKEGTPVENAQVNLALADQALAAIGGVIEPTILEDIYKSLPNMIYYNYNSHQPVLIDPPMAEMGGGGGGDREIFKDSAFFGQSRTGNDGKAVFEFTLPDNITSWIIFAQSVTNNLDTGHAENNLIVTQNFFVTSHFPNTILKSDKAFLTANSYGKNLNQDQQIQYESIFKRDDQEIVKSNQTGLAFREATFPFPSLDVGEYQATLRGKAGDNEDGVILPFSITETRFNFEMYTRKQLNSGQKMTDIGVDDYVSNKPVRLIVSDIGRGIHYYDLTRYCFTTSNRLEKRLAKVQANLILQDKFSDDICNITEQELAKFQFFDGGLAQVVWGSSNLEATVWATYIDSSRFNEDTLVEYLQHELENSNNSNLNKIYAVWGLVNMDESALTELKILAEQAYSFEEKVIVALAFVSAGETEKALDIYYDILADNAFEYKPYIRIQTVSSNAENILDRYVEDTAHALLLGSLVDERFNEGMYVYTRDYKTQTEDIVLDLADIAYINDQLSKLPEEDTQVTFNSSSRETTHNLSRGRSFVINLQDNEIGNFSLNVDTGKAEISTNYYITPEQFQNLSSDDRLSIQRQYSKVRGKNDILLPGDIVKIKINFDLDIHSTPLGGYKIVDHLPSGMTYINNPHAYGLEPFGWTREADHNVIETRFYNSPWWQKHGHREVVYYARINAVGSYIAEPAVIQSQKELSVFNSTNESILKIESR